VISEIAIFGIQNSPSLIGNGNLNVIPFRLAYEWNLHNTLPVWQAQLTFIHFFQNEIIRKYIRVLDMQNSVLDI